MEKSINPIRFVDYMIRELKMVRTTGTGPNRDPEERSIFQYHFLMWKDFQAPEHPSGILKFIWRVNEAYSLEKGPILVHCRFEFEQIDVEIIPRTRVL